MAAVGIGMVCFRFSQNMYIGIVTGILLSNTKHSITKICVLILKLIIVLLKERNLQYYLESSRDFNQFKIINKFWYACFIFLQRQTYVSLLCNNFYFEKRGSYGSNWRNINTVVRSKRKLLVKRIIFTSCVP